MSPKTDLIARLEQRAAICILQTDAADLRAAAAAVRLVAECREALWVASKAVPQDDITPSGRIYPSQLKSDILNVIAKIAEWEAKHGPEKA